MKDLAKPDANTQSTHSGILNKLRALREGEVKDRLLLLVIGSLSIWCLSWGWKAGAGLVKEIEYSVPRGSEAYNRQWDLRSEKERGFNVYGSDTRAKYQHIVDEATPWRNFLPFEILYRGSWLINPTKDGPYGLIQAWSGKAGLGLFALWLLLWVLTGKKQNEYSRDKLAKIAQEPSKDLLKQIEENKWKPK